MVGLRDIPGIGGGSAELLEAAGYPSARELALVEAPRLLAELKKANGALRILKKGPSLGQVERWIEAARGLTGQEPPQGADGEPVQAAGSEVVDDREVDFEADPVVIEMLENAPLAIPVPPGLLSGQEIPVGEVAEGVLLRRVRGDIEIRVDTRQAKQRKDPLENSSPGTAKAAGNEPVVRRGIDVSRVRSTEDLRHGTATPVAVAAESVPQQSRAEAIRTPSPELNRGKDPNSRSYIRGVLHPNPLRLMLASIVTLAVILTVPPAVVSSALLLLSDTWPEQFGWAPPWLLVVPLLLPPFGFLYLAVAVGGHCRICNQRLFVPRRCHKHQKAHHMRGLGYLIPMAAHMVFFKWFRCTYCGTAVRLKK